MLAVSLAAVPYYGNHDQRTRVIDGVNDAPITEANSPEVVRALELSAAGRARITRQGLDALENSPRDGAIKRLQFLARRARKDYCVLTHEFGVCLSAAAGA